MRIVSGLLLCKLLFHVREGLGIKLYVSCDHVYFSFSESEEINAGCFNRYRNRKETCSNLYTKCETKRKLIYKFFRVAY
jgi:hypothetical protein